MNWLDIVLLAFLVITAVMGLVRGLIKTLVPLIGLAIGVILAGHYHVWVANTIFRSHGTTAEIAAFVVVVFVFLIAALILASVLHGLLKIALLGWIDHVAGFLLGFVWAALVAGAILSLLLKYSVATSTISDSAIAAFLVDKFRLALALLPGDFGRVRGLFH
ncbi:MAG: CvpA family protein [Dehalococcoidales bacterium]|nr:CvpA family protein [Dehalococcoidales bacterium]